MIEFSGIISLFYYFTIIDHRFLSIYKIKSIRPPKEGPVRTEWIRVVKEHSQAINGHYQICNLHFRATQMERTTNGKVKLSPGAVPTNFDETNGNEIDPEQSLNIGSGNIHASTHHMYKQEFEKRLNLEIKLLRIQEQVSKLEVENDKLKSKNNELEVVLNSRDEKIRTLISELSVCNRPRYISQ